MLKLFFLDISFTCGRRYQMIVIILIINFKSSYFEKDSLKMCSWKTYLTVSVPVDLNENKIWNIKALWLTTSRNYWYTLIISGMLAMHSVMVTTSLLSLEILISCIHKQCAQMSPLENIIVLFKPVDDDELNTSIM